MKAAHDIPPATGPVRDERRLLGAIVADYQTVTVPRSFEHWLDGLCFDEAQRMRENLQRLIEAELARQAIDDDAAAMRHYARAEVLFRVGWALGAAAARR
jgi:hypothetical protein